MKIKPNIENIMRNIENIKLHESVRNIGNDILCT